MSTDAHFQKMQKNTNKQRNTKSPNHQAPQSSSEMERSTGAFQLDELLQTPNLAQPGDILAAQQKVGNQSVQRSLSMAQIDSQVTNHQGELDQEFTQEIRQASQTGQKLPDHLRQQMSNQLGHDFDRVKIHTGERADHLSRKINAQAFTVGNNIFFQNGAFDLHSIQGRQTLAHELTHVVQQSGTTSLPERLTLGEPDDHFERQANQAAESTSQSDSLHQAISTPAARVQRNGKVKNLASMFEEQIKQQQQPPPRPQRPSPQILTMPPLPPLPHQTPTVSQPTITTVPQTTTTSPQTSTTTSPTTTTTVPQTTTSTQQTTTPVPKTITTSPQPSTTVATQNTPSPKKTPSPQKVNTGNIDMKRTGMEFKKWDDVSQLGELTSGALTISSFAKGEWGSESESTLAGGLATASAGIDTVSGIANLGKNFYDAKKYRGRAYNSEAGQRIRKEKGKDLGISTFSGLVGLGTSGAYMASGIGQIQGNDTLSSDAGAIGGGLQMAGGLFSGIMGGIGMVGSHKGKGLARRYQNKTGGLGDIAKVHKKQQAMKKREAGMDIFSGASNIVAGLGSALGGTAGSIMGIVGTGASMLGGIGKRINKTRSPNEDTANMAAKNLAQKINSGDSEAKEYAKELLGVDDATLDKLKNDSKLEELISMNMGF